LECFWSFYGLFDSSNNLFCSVLTLDEAD